MLAWCVTLRGPGLAREGDAVGRKRESAVTFLLILVLGMLAMFVGMPLLFVVFDVVGAWYDHWCDRLDVAVERFCRARGWR